MKRKHTSKRMLGILLTICMVVSLLPMTAITAFAASYPESVRVNNNITLDGSTPYYINGASSATNSSSGYNAYYNSNTGVLTLNGYSGGRIVVNDNQKSGITVKLNGNNTISRSGSGQIFGFSYSGNGMVNITSSSGGKLTVNVTSTGEEDAVAIAVDYSASYTTAALTIDGSAQLVLNASNTSTGTAGNRGAYGIYFGCGSSGGGMNIKGSASVQATAAANGANMSAMGFYSGGKVEINTVGDVSFDVSGSSPTKTEGDYCMRSNSGIQVTNVGTLTCKYLTNNGYAYPGYLTTIDSSLTKTTSVSGNVTTEVWTKGAASLTTIDSVAITGVTAPVAGQGSTTAGITTSTTGVSIDSSSTATFWLVLDTDTNSWHYFDGTFEAGKTYGISVRVRPTDSTQYAFADSITATVNGNPATEIDKSGTGGVNRKIVYSFGELSGSSTPLPATITTVDVSDINLPIVGEAPDFEVTLPADANYHLATAEDLRSLDFTAEEIERCTNGVCWKNITEDGWLTPTDKFEAGKKYYIEVVLIPETGYSFTNDTTATVNGGTENEESSRKLSGYNAFIVFSVNWTPSASTTTEIETVNLTLTAPKTGNAPSMATTTDTAYTVANTSWDPEDDPFKANTAYTATINLETTGADMFTENTKFYINGKEATLISLNPITGFDDEVRIVYTFPKTEGAGITLTGTNDPVTGKPMLTWNAVPGAANYEIYAYNDMAMVYALIDTTANTTFTHTSAKVGKNYSYKVKAIPASTSAAPSTSDVVYVTCKYPTPQVTGSNDAETGRPKLTWAKVDGATKYEVYRYDKVKKVYVKMYTTTGTTYTNTIATIGETYFYKVKALGAASAATSAFSKPVTLTYKYATPVVKGTNDPVTGRNVLNWEKVDGATKYEVYRYDKVKKVYVKMYTTTGTTYTNTIANAGETYFYKVKALGQVAAATSAFSKPVTLTYKYATPVVKGTNDPVTGRNVLNWEKVDGATKYEVYRYDKVKKVYVKMYTTTATTYTNTIANTGETYFYKVKALGPVTAATSAFSKPVTLTYKYATPVVTGSNDPVTGRNVLNWEKVDGATKYEVYRYDKVKKVYVKMYTTTGTTYTNTIATVGETYFYKVKALGPVAAATSAFSKPVTLTYKCATPVLTGSNDASTGKPKVSWGKIEGATQYEVYRYNSVSKVYVKIKTTTSTSYIDTTAVKGTSYFYKVKALGATTAANSALSTQIKITCK